MSASFASNAETTVDSNAGTTICMSQVKLTSIVIPNNNRIEVQFEPDEYNLGPSAYNHGRIQMWQGGSYIRWKNKLDILRDAFVSNKKVTVGSRDDNCKGNDDEFYIKVYES